MLKSTLNIIIINYFYYLIIIIINHNLQLAMLLMLGFILASAVVIESETKSLEPRVYQRHGLMLEGIGEICKFEHELRMTHIGTYFRL